MPPTHPPATDRRPTLANWRAAPGSAWAFHNVRQLIPTAPIPIGPSPWVLPENLTDLSGLALPGEPSAPGEPSLTLGAYLAASHTDGLVVLKDGAVVFEYQRAGVPPDAPHILMSVSKSMLGLLAGALAAAGLLDVNRLASDYIPALADTAYREVSVRQLLDMRAGVRFDEDYLATSGPIIDYRKAQGWNEVAVGEAPGDLRSFLTSLKESDGPHGGRFHYVSPNTDLLGWVFEVAASAPYAHLMSEHLWRPMGAETEAYVTVDRLGAPRAAGGMCVTCRDLARVGQMVLQRGAGPMGQVLAEDWIEDIMEAGDAGAWREGDFADKFHDTPMHYRSKWYVFRGPEPVLACSGIHGQKLFVSPARGVVIAKLSCLPAPADEEDGRRDWRMAQAVMGEI